YATSNGSATSGSLAATGGQDYVATSGTVTFPAGSTSQLVSVFVNGDTLNENNETFSVTLSNPVGASSSGSDVATGTISNDDALPSVSITGANANEGN